MNHLDLFSGIGGFVYAARMVWEEDHEPLLFCEIDEYPQQILDKLWPSVPLYEDIRHLDARPLHGSVDILTGGFPCQPYSNAGKRRGSSDDRALWPAMRRVVDQCRPRYILGENVPGIISMELDAVLSDLEDLDYSARAVVIPACAVDAKHRRDRVWIMAYDESRIEWQSTARTGERSKPEFGDCRRADAVAYTDRIEPQRSGVAGKLVRAEGAERHEVQQRQRNGHSTRGCSEARQRGDVPDSTREWWEPDRRFKFESGRYQEGHIPLWLPEPGLARVVDGLSYRLDRDRTGTASGSPY